MKLLKEEFIPVAIDQWYQRRQRDPEGDFWRKIARQGPRSNFELTTQGKYVATADGSFLGYNNNRGPEPLLQMMRRAKEKFETTNDSASVIVVEKRGKMAIPVPSPGTLIIRVNAKVIDGYKKTTQWTHVFHDATSRDNLWIKAEELPGLINAIENGGNVPMRIARRIARFHLVDNTRGEPPRWTNDEVRRLELSFSKDGILTGKVHLQTQAGDRGFVATIYGIATTRNKSIERFDMVAKGKFWGKGPYTNYPPEGKFPLAIAFRMADNTDPSDPIMPHGAKGWLQGYFESELH